MISEGERKIQSIEKNNLREIIKEFLLTDRKKRRAQIERFQAERKRREMGQK